MTVTHHERRHGSDHAIRVTAGVLSIGASVVLGLLALLSVGLMGDSTNKALANALILFCIGYTVGAGYLGWWLVLRSWAWWSVWVVAALVIVPFALIQGLLYVLD